MSAEIMLGLTNIREEFDHKEHKERTENAGKKRNRRTLNKR